MTVEILRRAVRDDVGAELDRALDVRARERVVDDEARVMAVREVGGRAKIREAHDRVRRRFDEQHARRFRERALGLVQVACVDVGE